ncbi:MAG: hypothetical protein HOF21_12170 [Nitrospina sp.]|nr:hypothetical protein [Nitrospina sp.]MBT5633139.1 hypothetical protein [Nitrospina sp.]
MRTSLRAARRRGRYILLWLLCPEGVDPETLDCFVVIDSSQRRVRRMALAKSGLKKDVMLSHPEALEGL